MRGTGYDADGWGGDQVKEHLARHLSWALPQRLAPSGKRHLCATLAIQCVPWVIRYIEHKHGGAQMTSPPAGGYLRLIFAAASGSRPVPATKLMGCDFSMMAFESTPVITGIHSQVSRRWYI